MRIYAIIAALLALAGLLVLGYLNIKEKPQGDAPSKPPVAEAKKPATAAKKKEAGPKKPQVIKEWNLTKGDVKSSGWRFPTAGAVASPEGITYTQTGTISSGPNAKDLKIDAKKGQRLSVTLSAVQVEANEKLPKTLKGAQLFWATDEDVKAKNDQWSFSNDKLANLKPDPKNPNVWTVQFFNDKWSGKIERLMVKPIFEEYINAPIPDGKSLEITLKGVKLEQ